MRCVARWWLLFGSGVPGGHAALYVSGHHQCESEFDVGFEVDTARSLADGYVGGVLTH
jgi:hypothetical protein